MAPLVAALGSFVGAAVLLLTLPGDTSVPLSLVFATFSAGTAASLFRADSAVGVASSASIGAVIPFFLWLVAVLSDSDQPLSDAVTAIAVWTAGFALVAGTFAWGAAVAVAAVRRRT